MIRKITTKTGDKGMTRLFSGEKVPKSAPRINACGDIDELISILGVARSHARKVSIKKEILAVQKSLFVLGAELATTKNKCSKLKKRVDQKMVVSLDKKTSILNERIGGFRGFVVPGSNPPSSYLDVARCITRRCERKIVRLFNQKEIENEHVLAWLNRLSDYLYLLARSEESNSEYLED